MIPSSTRRRIEREFEQGFHRKREERSPLVRRVLYERRLRLNREWKRKQKELK